MARALTVGSEVVAVNPAFSALAALGLEESVVQMGPVDAALLVAIADAIPDVAAQPPAAANADLEGPVTATIAGVASTKAFVVVESLDGAPELMAPAPAEETEAGVAESAPDPLLVIVPSDFSGEAKGVAIPIQVQEDLSFLDRKIVFDFRSEGLDLSAAVAGDSIEIAVSDAARPGGGGGPAGGGSSGVLAQYSSGSGNGTEGYDILIQFKGTGWTETLQQAFKNAADYFTGVITHDIGGGGRIGKIIVDDLYVTAEVKAIDGEGGILGQAGPTNVWSANELTAAGQMQFDVADALDYSSIGLWDDIVTHELMHVLGLGSLWNYGKNPLVSGDHYIGANAVLAYDQTIAGTTQTYIPVEDEGGSGTAGSHWDEQALLNELMTGYIDGDSTTATVNDNYLSKFSVMSLADLGYKVAYVDYSYDGTTIA
jgi:hypothetical protein